jgi:lipopolysaccharide exporter
VRSLLARYKINVRGELFSSTFTYGVTSVIRLVSSLVLTRMLDPQAYGIFAILLSFMFMIEMLSDLAPTSLLIRHPRGGERRFVHTIWTMRLIRNTINFCVLFLGAPLLAKIYAIPLLTSAFRLYSVAILLGAAESMSFVLLQRDQRARVSNYVEMIAQLVMTCCVIGLALVIRNHYALIYGSIVHRTFLTIASYFFYRNIGVGIAFDKEAMREQFHFARFVWPSSVLTIILTQYDKVVLLKMFNLATLGVYSIGQNMLGPISGVIVHNARVVLYARCAAYFRQDRTAARSRYYSENRRLLLVGIVGPAIVAGLSQFIVSALYDVRYSSAGYVLMVLGIATIVTAFQNASENLLVASGKTHAVLVSNVVRLVSLIPLTLLGYHLFGFKGFLWATALATVPPLLYYNVVQWREGLLDLRSELRLAALAAAIFLVCRFLDHWLVILLPPGWLHMLIKHHVSR